MAAMKRIIMIHQFLRNAYSGDHPEIDVTMKIVKKYCFKINSTERHYNYVINYLKGKYSDLPPQALAHVFSLVPEPTKKTDRGSRKKRFRPSGVEEVDRCRDPTFKRPDSPIVIDMEFKEDLRITLSEERRGKTLFQLCKRYITKNEELLHSYYTARNARVSEFVQENPDLAEENRNLIQAIIDDNDNKMIMIGDIETGDLFRIQQKTLAPQLPPSSS